MCFDNSATLAQHVANLFPGRTLVYNQEMGTKQRGRLAQTLINCMETKRLRLYPDDQLITQLAAFQPFTATRSLAFRILLQMIHYYPFSLATLQLFFIAYPNVGLGHRRVSMLARTFNEYLLYEQRVRDDDLLKFFQHSMGRISALVLHLF